MSNVADLPVGMAGLQYPITQISVVVDDIDRLSPHDTVEMLRLVRLLADLVTKFAPDGQTRIFSTYLGGSADEFRKALEVDGSGDIYLTGYTSSTNFPTVNAFQPVRTDGIPNPIVCDPFIPFFCRTPFYTGLEDVFVAKLKGNGSALVFSTYLGGRKQEEGQSLAIDDHGNVYVTGFTDSVNFPTVDPYQAANAGNRDVFIAKLNPGGTALVYSTYLGASGDEQGSAIAIDSGGNAYVAGTTDSPLFPIPVPFKFYGGGNDAFAWLMQKVLRDQKLVPTPVRFWRLSYEQLDHAISELVGREVGQQAARSEAGGAIDCSVRGRTRGTHTAGVPRTRASASVL